MADPQQPAIDLSAGLVPNTPAPTPDAGGIDLSAGMIPKASTENVPGRNPARVQDDSLKPQPSDPDYYNGEGAVARFSTKAYRAMGGGALGDTNAEVKQRLKEIALHPVDQSLAFGKGIMSAQEELAHKAKQAWQNGDHVGAAAYALYYLMPGIGPSLAKAGEQMSSGDIAGGLGTTVGTAAPMVMDVVKPEPVMPKTGFKAASEASAKEAAVKPAAKTASAEETTPAAKPLQEAGKQVQAEAKATRDVAGKKVAAAKEAAQATLPKKSTMPLVTLDKGALGDTAKKVLDETADTEQLAGAKDPDMAAVRDMADHLSKGQNAKGEVLTLDPEQVDSVKRAFNNKIDELQGKVEAGGNGTALKQLKALKQSYMSDVYDAFEKYGDPKAGQDLKAASKEYAKIVDDQTAGPARAMFRNQSPEKIVSTIVSSGARSQSAVESLIRNMSDSGKETLRGSVLKRIYDKNVLPDGTIDMVKARKNFYSLGDTAKTLYGGDLKATTDYLDAASKEQVARNAKAGKPSITSRVVSKVGKAAGTGVGAGVGSVAGTPGAVAGAVVGSELADAVFENGKSGAVKIGISPTERIVLSPAEAAAKRPMITKFLKAKSAGNVAAMTAVYNALANPVRKTDNQK